MGDAPVLEIPLVGSNDPRRSLPTWNILWFCDLWVQW